LGNLNSWKASSWGKVGAKAIGQDTGILRRDRDNQWCWDDSNKIVGQRRFRALYQEPVHIKIWDGPFLFKKKQKRMMTTDDYVGIDPCKSVCEACLVGYLGDNVAKAKEPPANWANFAVRSCCDVLLASSRVFSRALGEAT
jgi:hypothetical protein